MFPLCTGAQVSIKGGDVSDIVLKQTGFNVRVFSDRTFTALLRYVPGADEAEASANSHVPKRVTIPTGESSLCVESVGQWELLPDDCFEFRAVRGCTWRYPAACA